MQKSKHEITSRSHLLLSCGCLGSSVICCLLLPFFEKSLRLPTSNFRWDVLKVFAKIGFFKNTKYFLGFFTIFLQAGNRLKRAKSSEFRIVSQFNLLARPNFTCYDVMWILPGRRSNKSIDPMGDFRRGDRVIFPERKARSQGFDSSNLQLTSLSWITSFPCLKLRSNLYQRISNYSTVIKYRY
jgi:hypothetical protein